MDYDPLVTMATARIREPLLQALGVMGSCSLHELAVMVGEDDSIVVGACRRLADEGLVRLNTETRRVELPSDA